MKEFRMGLGLVLLMWAWMAAPAAFADDSSTQTVASEKQQLEDARKTYQDAVSAYGENSPQALQARAQLRRARSSYHNAIRQRIHRADPGMYRR